MQAMRVVHGFHRSAVLKTACFVSLPVTPAALCTSAVISIGNPLRSASVCVRPPAMTVMGTRSQLSPSQNKSCGRTGAGATSTVPLFELVSVTDTNAREPKPMQRTPSKT